MLTRLKVVECDGGRSVKNKVVSGQRGGER